MRWFWADRFTEFASGKSATAIKRVSLSEPHLHDHCEDFPHMPVSLVIEGCALTGGLLVAEANQYHERVVLAKVSHARFGRPILGGDSLRYLAKLEDLHADGAVVSFQIELNDEPYGEAELFFAHVDEARAGSKTLFEPHDMMNLIRLLGILDVGVDADGAPLQAPTYLVEAEANHEAKISELQAD